MKQSCKCITLSEHKTKSVIRSEAEKESISETIYTKDPIIFDSFLKLESQQFNSSSYKYSVKKNKDLVEITADYCIGIDWLGETNRIIHIEPKINSAHIEYFESVIDNDTDTEDSKKSISSETYELDFLQMLLDVYSGKIEEKYLKDLLFIDWYAKQIPIKQNQDHLTPFLIVQFLQLLNRIVAKGLKKTYYTITQNLTNKVKGKILIAQQIKQNTLKGRLTKTMCHYQVFGEDNPENRFLKKVLTYVSQYVQSNTTLFYPHVEFIKHLISYCRPSFEKVGTKVEESELRHIKPNPFFKEYLQAIKIGKCILKRFSYNISKTAEKTIKIPPFWIDMPRLFELYVYHHLLTSNENAKEKILYQFSTYGNSLDFLIKDDKHSMIIDTKYKLHYEKGHLHQDIRQVSGYARLNKVREKLEIKDDSNINCLIIYPSFNGVNLSEEKLKIECLISDDKLITPYYKIFKLGVQLPLQR